MKASRGLVQKIVAQATLIHMLHVQGKEKDRVAVYAHLAKMFTGLANMRAALGHIH